MRTPRRPARARASRPTAATPTPTPIPSGRRRPKGENPSVRTYAQHARDIMALLDYLPGEVGVHTARHRTATQRDVAALALAKAALLTALAAVMHISRESAKGLFEDIIRTGGPDERTR